MNPVLSTPCRHVSDGRGELHNGVHRINEGFLGSLLILLKNVSNKM
jgi:hypothetical protein